MRALSPILLRVLFFHRVARQWSLCLLAYVYTRTGLRSDDGCCVVVTATNNVIWTSSASYAVVPILPKTHDLLFSASEITSTIKSMSTRSSRF